MTIKIECECDAYGCCNSAEISDSMDSTVERAGYFTDPLNSEYHYYRIEHEEGRGD